MLQMFGDLVDLLERAAADGQPIRDLVGNDPTDFVETFIDAYRGHGNSFVEKERAKLVGAVDSAVAEQQRDVESGPR
jgi:DNA-binding ferritin-like protein (Dps family)